MVQSTQTRGSSPRMWPWVSRSTSSGLRPYCCSRLWPLPASFSAARTLSFLHRSAQRTASKLPVPSMTKSRSDPPPPPPLPLPLFPPSEDGSESLLEQPAASTAQRPSSKAKRETRRAVGMSRLRVCDPSRRRRGGRRRAAGWRTGRDRLEREAASASAFLFVLDFAAHRNRDLLAALRDAPALEALALSLGAVLLVILVRLFLGLPGLVLGFIDLHDLQAGGAAAHRPAPDRPLHVPVLVDRGVDALVLAAPRLLDARGDDAVGLLARVAFQDLLHGRLALSHDVDVALVVEVDARLRELQGRHGEVGVLLSDLLQLLLPLLDGPLLVLGELLHVILLAVGRLLLGVRADDLFLDLLV